MFFNLLSVKAYRAPLEGCGACADGEWTDEHLRMLCYFSLLCSVSTHSHLPSWIEKGSQGEDRPQLVECLPGIPRFNL